MPSLRPSPGSVNFLKHGTLASAIRIWLPFMSSAARFASDDIFVAAAGDCAQGDRAGTLAKLEDGLKRCPRSNRLWQLMFEMRLEEIHRGEAEKIALEQLLGHLEQAESAGMVSPFLSAYYRGSILDSLGKCDEALDCFVEALKAAENPRDRIRTRSKISELQTRRARHGPELPSAPAMPNGARPEHNHGVSQLAKGCVL